MLILGIETSCDETAMAILEVTPHIEVKPQYGKKMRVLSNIISSQVKIHAKYGGVFPALAAREHTKNIDKVFKLALKGAMLKSAEEIDLIAVTHGPGLAVALVIGVTFAKTLAWKYKKPIIGINHLAGHIYSNWLPLSNPGSRLAISPPLDPRLFARDNDSNSFDAPASLDPSPRVGTFDDPSGGYLADLPKIFPALNLIVSGGHTELVLMKNHGQYKVIGETVDDAAGEAFDKIARLLGLGYPGGPLISQEAEKFSKSKIPPLVRQIVLPRPMINSKNFDFSFSGLKTAVLYKLKDLTSRFNLDEIRPAMAHEAQEAIVDVLTAKTLKAAEKYKPKSILLSGGVSANYRLRTVLKKETEKSGINYFQPELKYTGDNAAMIALAGYFNYAENKKETNFSWKTIKVNPNLNIG